jgi:NAD(P)-dependent dehydrogenase (short-subunit alcohol dehydrogenase family)
VFVVAGCGTKWDMSNWPGLALATMVGMATMGISLGFVRRLSGTTTSGAVLRTIQKFKGYSSLSVPPGEMPKEAQDTSINPIDESSLVLVVGASRGLGLEFVEQLLAKGATVIATHREAKPPPSLSKLSAGTIKLSCLRLDVADENSIVDASKILGDRIGSSLSHIIHNAGVIGDRQGLGAVTSDDMMEVLKINVVGPTLVAQSFAPLFDKNLEAPVLAIMTSKVGSIDDNGSGGIYAYRSSKSACNQIAKSLSIDMAEDGVKVLLLHPGYVRTDMTKGNGLIDKPESVTGLLRAIESTGKDTPFRYVDYKADLIPW